MTTTLKQAPSACKLALMTAMVVCAAGVSIQSQAAQATATASGTVVAPIAIAVVANLAFGSFAPGAGGTVTVSTSGARTTTGPVLLSGAPGTAARFNITGAPNTTYSISHSGTAVLTNTVGAGETMTLAKCSALTAANATSGNVIAGTLDVAGAQSLYVGGTLTVASNQVPGLYTGNVIATVEYN